MTSLTPRRRLAADINRTSNLHGEFLLRSGQVSDRYFDKYLFEADPALLHRIAQALLPLVPAEAEVVAGLELGGVPLAIMLSQLSGIPTAFVRKRAKEYGTRKLAEGAAIEGRRVLVVEDVVTSGGQVVLSSRDLRERGAIVGRAICVIDREAGGAEALAAEGVELRALFTRSELEAAV